MLRVVCDPGQLRSCRAGGSGLFVIMGLDYLKESGRAYSVFRGPLGQVDE